MSDNIDTQRLPVEVLVNLFGKEIALPNLKKVAWTSRMLKDVGEAMGSPYGTAFRNSFYLIEASGMQILNEDNPILDQVIAGCYDITEMLGKKTITDLVSSGLSGALAELKSVIDGPYGKYKGKITIKHNGNVVKKFYVLPYGIRLITSTKSTQNISTQSRNYEMVFLASDKIFIPNVNPRELAGGLGGFLTPGKGNSGIERSVPPLTTGKFQI